MYISFNHFRLNLSFFPSSLEMSNINNLSRIAKNLNLLNNAQAFKSYCLNPYGLKVTKKYPANSHTDWIFPIVCACWKRHKLQAISQKSRRLFHSATGKCRCIEVKSPLTITLSSLSATLNLLSLKSSSILPKVCSLSLLWQQ